MRSLRQNRFDAKAGRKNQRARLIPPVYVHSVPRVKVTLSVEVPIELKTPRTSSSAAASKLTVTPTEPHLIR